MNFLIVEMLPNQIVGIDNCWFKQSFRKKFVPVLIGVYQWFNMGLVKLNARTKKFLVVIRQSPLAWVLWIYRVAKMKACL